LNPVSDFGKLTPDAMLHAVETAVGMPLTGFTSPLPSYINRVYELQAEDGTRLIAKFYRPGRWSPAALEDEHAFLRDCVEDEIPVIAPMPLRDGKTLDEVDGIRFCVFPKKYGREFELNGDEDWLRIGRLLGRLHATGDRRDAPGRVTLHPGVSTAEDLRELIDGGFIPPGQRSAFEDLTRRISERIVPLFEDVPLSRVHGDCHRGNLLYRMEEGVFMIDFDDMATGPAVQDFWMLLPGHAAECRREIGLMLEGYEAFHTLDIRSLRLIEPLRMMRIIYFLAWCARQVNDYQFQNHFPDWGSAAFWEREIRDLEHQLRIVEENLEA